MRKDRPRRLVAMDLEKSSCTIRHRQRAAVQRRRRREKVESRELVDARMNAVRALECSGDYAFARRDAVQLTPGIARLDPVDPPAPRIVRNMFRW